MIDAALRSLTPYQAGNWAFSENAGYYIHNGRVYLQGEIGAQGQSGITAQILSGLPAAIRPSGSLPFTLTADITGTDDVWDPALELPLTYAATVHSDGSMSLDSPPPSSVTATPPGFYIDSAGIHDRYGAPFGLLVALANVSWPIAAVPDTYSPASFAPYLGPDFDDIDATVIRHGARVHLDGHVRARVDGAYRLCTVLPETLRPSGPDANGDFGVIACRDPRHGRVATFVGDQRLTFSNDQLPDVPPHHWGDPLTFPGLFNGSPTGTTGGSNMFQVSLDVQAGDEHFGPGESYSCPLYNLACVPIESIECGVIAPDGSGGSTGPFGGGATGLIGGLLINYDPLPDWIIIGAFVDAGAIGGVHGCLGCTDEAGRWIGGGCQGDPASVTVGVSSPGTLVDAGGNPVSASAGGPGETGAIINALVARGSLAYTDAPDDPRTALLWPIGEVGGIDFAWSGVGAGGSAEWSITITPFWERRKVYFKAGDVLDLTGCGWQVPYTHTELIPGAISAGPGHQGQLRWTRTHGSAGKARVPTAPPSGGNWSIAALVGLALSVGVQGDNAAVAGAIAMAESSGNSSAVNHNPGPPPSIDRGLWQINDYFHPDVSDACAFDPQCNAHAMYSISSGGTNWTPWATYNAGLHLPYLDAARAALANSASAGSGAGTQGQISIG